MSTCSVDLLALLILVTIAVLPTPAATQCPDPENTEGIGYGLMFDVNCSSVSISNVTFRYKVNESESVVNDLIYVEAYCAGTTITPYKWVMVLEDPDIEEQTIDGVTAGSECVFTGCYTGSNVFQIPNASCIFYDDIDVCETEDPCDLNAACTNTAGSFTCSCNPGYTGDGVSCTVINECETEDPCDLNAMCTNTAENFTCSCNPGYTGDGMSCTDIDECVDIGICTSGEVCTNMPGSYQCSVSAGSLSLVGQTLLLFITAIITVTGW